MRQGLAAGRTGAVDAVEPARRARSSPRAIGNQARLRQMAGAPMIQPKLQVGAVDDPLEREADHMADQVIRMPEGETVRGAFSTAPPQVGRTCAACAGEDEAVARAKPDASAAGAMGGEAPSAVHQVLASPGRPLDAGARAFFEPRFGRDFSGVRVHEDVEAQASARAIGARAYAAGDHLVFSGGEYAPGTESGRRLLAHELAHVAQQSGGARREVRRELGDEGAQPQQTGGAGTDSPLRTDYSCGNPVGLPLAETFVPNTTATLYSPAFHAASSRTLNIDLAAELGPSGGNPALSSVGVEVYQCCNISNSKISEQVIGGVGTPGRPVHTPATVPLKDDCTFSTKWGDEFVYYLRLRIASSMQDIRLSYSIT